MSDQVEKCYKELIEKKVGISLKLDEPLKPIEFEDILKWDSTINEKNVNIRLRYIFTIKKNILLVF